MKIFRFLLSLLLTVGLVYLLNQKIGNIPPLGKLLDPFHGFWQNAETNPLDMDLLPTLPQLSNEVLVQVEENLIPHIFAANDHDLYFTQGYLIAYHRLWQMEFIARVASGRISEIVGEAALDFDRYQRRKGLAEATERAMGDIQELKDAYDAALAFSDGVNAYIDQLDYTTLPLEYKILDYHPEKWSPAKSLLIQKYMASDLNSDRDLRNTNLVRLFGKSRFDFLFPDIPDDVEPIIPKGTPWDFEPVDVFSPDTFEIDVTRASDHFNRNTAGIGSNNWAVSGTKTASGSPILCNDPHLGLNLPMIWYAQQLNAPGISTYGVTIPGIPGIVIGFNDSIAWGVTNADRDLRDWYKITFRDDQSNEYLYGGKWLKTNKRVEIIKVRGQADYVDTVTYTHYGPVVYDRSFMGDSSMINFALKWTAHDASDELLTIYNLNRATNLEEALGAISNWGSPPQNFAIATRSGDIAQIVQGKYPMKWKEQGKFIMDGSDPKYEWQGFIPKEHNARVINPERGFISSANQHPFDNDYPYYYYSREEEHFRNKRINSVLSSMSGITPEDMKKLQNDNYFTLAAESLPIMLDSLKTNDLTKEQLEIVQLLREWNLMADPELTAPSYFQAWWIKMNKLLWDEFAVDEPIEWPPDHTTRVLLTKYPADSAFDILATEKVEGINDIMTKSFIQGIDSVETWCRAHEGILPVWHKFKGTRLMHMAKIQPFSYFDIKIGGYEGIVNATSHAWGASWRMIVELGEEITGWGIYPGGQSGNPGSPGYNTFLDEWANGRYFKIQYWDTFDDKRENVRNYHFTRESIE